MSAFEHFRPRQPQRKANSTSDGIPNNFLVQIKDPEIARKYFEYCVQHGVSGTQCLLQFIFKLTGVENAG